MHFEHLCSSTLRDATNADTWSAVLQAANRGGQRATTPRWHVLGIGADHEGFQSLFADRTASSWQSAGCVPLDELDAEVRRSRSSSWTRLRSGRPDRRQLWAAYRPDYEHYLRPCERWTA